jgi:hypothetical protein
MSREKLPKLLVSPLCCLKVLLALTRIELYRWYIWNSVAFNGVSDVGDFINAPGKIAAEQIFSLQMNDSKVEVAYNLVPESPVFWQNQLVVFEFESGYSLSLKIEHYFVEELNWIAVPFDREPVNEIWLFTAFTAVGACDARNLICRENFGVRTDFRMRAKKVNQHSASRPCRTGDHVNIIAIRTHTHRDSNSATFGRFNGVSNPQNKGNSLRCSNGNPSSNQPPLSAAAEDLIEMEPLSSFSPASDPRSEVFALRIK